MSQIAATGFKAGSSLLKGFTAWQSDRYNASVSEAQGQQARMDAGIQSQFDLEQGDRETATGIVAAASSGGGLGGSARGVLEDLGRQNLYQVRQAATQGIAAQRAASAQASLYRKQATISLITGVTDAASTILGTAMKMAPGGAPPGGADPSGGGGADASAGGGDAIAGLG